MQGGLFIALYDEESLKLYLNKGIYGFLMNPIFEDKPSAKSKHYAALADYACSREGSHVFFFIKRKIVYGGKIYGNKDCSSFYLNGNTSPLGRKIDAKLFWDESERYVPTEKDGVFKFNGKEKSQPFIFQFDQDDNTGKYIVSDDLYFELGNYPYPLPSNSMQGMSFCTLTPGEVDVLVKLISENGQNIDYKDSPDVNRINEGTLFNKKI